MGKKRSQAEKDGYERGVPRHIGGEGLASGHMFPEYDPANLTINREVAEASQEKSKASQVTAKPDNRSQAEKDGYERGVPRHVGGEGKAAGNMFPEYDPANLTVNKSKK